MSGGEAEGHPRIETGSSWLRAVSTGPAGARTQGPELSAQGLPGPELKDPEILTWAEVGA